MVTAPDVDFGMPSPTGDYGYVKSGVEEVPATKFLIAPAVVDPPAQQVFNLSSPLRVPPPVDVPAVAPFKPPWAPMQSSRFPLRDVYATLAPRPRMHYSLILQMDGLLHVVFRQRLERDACAASLDDAFCELFGPGASPASTFCGLFFPPPQNLGSVIDAVRAERGMGIFVGPADHPSLASFIDSPRNLIFRCPGPNDEPWIGLFITFAYQGKVKAKKKDRVFYLRPLLSRQVPLKVGILPFCPARMSSSPHVPRPTDDTAKPKQPLPAAADVPKPVQLGSWNVCSMQRLASIFPHGDVAQLFRLAILPTGAPSSFVGDRSKRVSIPNAHLEPEVLAKIKDRFVTEVTKGRMLGPFDRCPFPNSWCPHQARSTPLDTRKKDKYDPLSDRFRVISNFSAGGSSSINNLIYSPKLLSSHLQSSQLRDILYLLGPASQFCAIDQEDAFRANSIDLQDAHLYCYQVGPQWFVDLRDPFGNVESEWTYAVIVAIIKWALQGDASIVGPSSFLLGYVDNWFLLSKADDVSHMGRWAALKSFFTSLGPKMHEEQVSHLGPVDALGWSWDLTTGSMSCPDDKFDACVSRSSEFARRAVANDVFSLHDVESLAGLFQWISTACPVIIAPVASLQALKHRLKRSSDHRSRLDRRCRAATIALSDFFRSWNRRCNLFAGFSPVVSWEVLIRSDASTDFGAGAFCLPSRRCGIHAWTGAERAEALQEQRESTMFFELLAILLTIRKFSESLKGKRVQIECDNEAAVRVLCSCFSERSACMAVVEKIRDTCANLFIIPRYEHILSAFNTVADALSHDHYDQAAREFLAEYSVALLEPELL